MTTLTALFGRYTAMGLAALLLVGCAATVPHSIQGTSSTPQQDLYTVRSAPQIFIGQEARFGGTVVGVQNQAQRTRLEIASMPLDAGGRPRLGMGSQGRLFAYVDGFIDPVDLAGQLVTVVGPITGSVSGLVGMTPYTFVEVDALGLQRWRIQQQVVIPPGPPPHGWRHDDRWGRHGPGWSHWHDPRPARIQTIVTK